MTNFDDHDQKPKLDPSDAETEAADDTEEVDTDLPDLDPSMFAQVEEMMGKLSKYDELERENADLKGKLSRLAADFESYRRRTAQETQEAEGAGVAKAAETLLPIYDDLTRALEMGGSDPTKIMPGLQNVQGALLRTFEKLGVSTVGQEGETFDPRDHEALQVVPGERDDVIVQVYQLGFRLGDRLVRPARVVVSRASN